MKTLVLLISIICCIFLTCCNNESIQIEKEDESQNLCNDDLWYISSTPDQFPESQLENDTRYGFNRAKLAWYNIDPEVFYRNSILLPNHLRNDIEQLKTNKVRDVFENEIYPNREAPYGQPISLTCFNLDYYPNERGPYNYDIERVAADGTLIDQVDRWAGICCKISQKASIDTISFWMMSPFILNANSSVSGSVYFNIGHISNDVLKDGYIHSEATQIKPEAVQETKWGKIRPNDANLKNFDSNPDRALLQDAGIDGLRSDQVKGINEEAQYFNTFIDALNLKLNDLTFDKILLDPSSDDFSYYLGANHDALEIPSPYVIKTSIVLNEIHCRLCTTVNIIVTHCIFFLILRALIRRIALL